jgi:hypothetical protein
MDMAWFLVQIVQPFAKRGFDALNIIQVGRQINRRRVTISLMATIPEAVACYRRALELAPDAPELHNNLGIALKDEGKLDEARRVCSGCCTAQRCVEEGLTCFSHAGRMMELKIWCKLHSWGVTMKSLVPACGLTVFGLVTILGIATSVPAAEIYGPLPFGAHQTPELGSCSLSGVLEMAQPGELGSGSTINLSPTELTIPSGGTLASFTAVLESSLPVESGSGNTINLSQTEPMIPAGGGLASSTSVNPGGPMIPWVNPGGSKKGHLVFFGPQPSPTSETKTAAQAPVISTFSSGGTEVNGGSLVLSGGLAVNTYQGGTVTLTGANTFTGGTSLTVGPGSTFVYDPSQDASYTESSISSPDFEAGGTFVYDPSYDPSQALNGSLLQANGGTISSLSAAGVVSAVPEPGTLVLLLIAAASACLLRRGT